MSSYIHFREDPYTTVEKTIDGKAVQFGKGLILWSDTFLHLYQDGVELQIDSVLNDCSLVRTLGGYRSIYGTDEEGRAWCVKLGDNWSYDVVKAKDGVLWLDRERIASLFKGRSFKEVLAEVRRIEHEREIDVLRKDAEFGKLAREALLEIKVINDQAGPKSRVKVTEILNRVLNGS